MNELKPILRLILLTQTFLLFAAIFLPVLIRSMQQPAGRWIYGLFAAICIALALLLRRALDSLG